MGLRKEIVYLAQPNLLGFFKLILANANVLVNFGIKKGIKFVNHATQLGLNLIT